MVGSWGAFASSFTEDDPLLFLPSSEADDDPSSYLLYPPGFGPVEDWLVDPAPPRSSIPTMFGGQPKESDQCGGALAGDDGGKDGAAADGFGRTEVVGLSEALSGKISLVGDSELSLSSRFAEKDGVPEYVVIGSLGIDGDGGEPGGGDINASIASPLCVNGEGDNVVREAPVTPSEVNMDGDGKGEDNSRSGGSSESEGDDSSSSSSSSSEESSEEEEEEEDGGDEDDGENKRKKKSNGVVDLEEGEIRDLDIEELAMSSDDDVATKGPIKSKNELEDLPPVLPVNATLEPHHQTHSVGAISSIVDNRVIVEGVAEHNPLNEGSILWVTETRSPLGTVDEIFGPVKNPYYIVRYNSEEEIPAGICEGTAISFASEFAGHILNDPSLYKKGYDASGENDEEVDEEVEFSDDEREAEYRRSLRQTKRGTDGSRQRNSEPFDKKKAQFDKRRIQDRGSGYMNSWKEERLPVPGESSSPRGPMQHRSRPQRPFIRGQSQRSPHRPSQAPTSPHPPCVPVHAQSSNQIQSQMQAPPPLQPFAHGQPLQLPTLPPYVMGQLQMPMLAAPCNPGPPAHAGAVNVPHAYFQGPHSVPGIPYGGQSGGPLGQNFFMQQPNPFWPLGAPSQQFITAFPGMLPANGMQGQQIQGHPYPQNQNQAFPGFANGPTFQFAFSPNQGLPPGMPWQGCSPPYPSAAMLSSEPAPRDGVSQTVPPGPIGGGEQGPASLSNGNQTAGAPPMKFNMGRHLGRGRRPFSRGSGGRGRGRGGG